MSFVKQRLGVNIDHVATLRQARGEGWPCPVRAAHLAQKAGAHGITAHLREDRRHIQDDDVFAIKEQVDLPLNFEMAATDEMVAIALKLQPNACCIVPEKREEVTTEGGLDVVGNELQLEAHIKQLKQAGIRVSLFVDADVSQLEAASRLQADIVELHTGAYATATGALRDELLLSLQHGAKKCSELGLECHAGHGLTFDNVRDIAAIPEVVELNIGHFIIGESVFLGMNKVVHNMLALMSQARCHLDELSA